MKPRSHNLIPVLVCLSTLFIVANAHACSVCFGQSDSDAVRGLHMGVLVLLAVVLSVLGGIAGFFVYLAKRSAAAQPVALAQPTR